jgi:hypothetical protein
MIEFMQTIGGQRFLAKIERFTNDMPEKLDKLAVSLDNMAAKMDKLAALNRTGVAKPSSDEPSSELEQLVATKTLDVEDLQRLVDAYDIEDDDLVPSEEKIVKMPAQEQEEHHIPIIFGGSGDAIPDEESTPHQTGVMNQQHVKTEEPSVDEEEDSKED